MTIKVYDAIYDTVSIYKNANTPAQRALAGYIIKSGRTGDPIFGGALALLHNIEHCNANREIYKLYSLVDRETEKKIIHVAQITMDGKFDRFAISEKERQDTIKYLCQPI